MLHKWAVCLMIWVFFAHTITYGQSADSSVGGPLILPAKFLQGIQHKTASLDGQLSRNTARYLAAAARQEKHLRRKLSSVDSAGAVNLFNGSEQQYANLERKVRTDTGGRDIPLHGAYMAYIDSLKNSLAFLRQNQSLMGNNPALQARLQQSVSSFQQLQAKMQDAEQVQQFLQQRKEQIRQYIEQHTQLPSDIGRAYDGYKKQAYYYSQQLQSYKDALNDPDKLFKAGLKVLDQFPAYREFVAKNSMLASIFNIPSNAPSGNTVQGMATRDQVLAAIQGPSPTGNSRLSGALQQNVQSAQGQVDGLRDKLNASGSADLTQPDFKPNNQRTKSFLRRLEYGTDLQSTHSTVFFPMTTDIGVSVGFKLDSKNVIGIGASYKMGWGSNIQHIHLTGQGVGLRSFADIRVKDSWYASGGYEYNYQKPFPLTRIPVQLENWQRSGLIGISKVVPMRTRFLKKAKLQLLWDFLSYSQMPKTQPFKFRIGYNF